MRLVFQSTTLPHPNSDKTIYDVSVDLEKRYHLLAHFFKYIESDLKKRIEKEAKRNPKFKTMIIDEWIKNKWREWILDGNYGIITQASKKRGNQSFVDSGAYYMNIYPKLILNEAKNGKRHY